MKIIRVFLLHGVILMGGMDLLAQVAVPPENPGSEFGIDPESWSKIQERWIRAQPVGAAYTGPGEYSAGQLVHVSTEEVVLFRGKGLPVGSEWMERMVRIPYDEIDSVLLQKGGNRLLRAKKAEAMDIRQTTPGYYKSYTRLREASIYVDSLAPITTMEEAFKNSTVLRQAFPDKHFRLSFGFGFGGDVASDDLSEVVNSFPGHGLEYNGSQAYSVEMIDLSVRFLDRFIFGWQFFGQGDYAYMGAGQLNDLSSGSLNVSVGKTEHRIYAEYALWHVDRYFTRRFEVLVGAGFLISTPSWDLSYYYDNYENPDQPLSDQFYYSYTDHVMGAQARGSVHCYFFPGMSLFTGLEVNFYQPFIVPERDFTSAIPGESVVIQEQTLNFNSVRFKLGVSIYL